MEAKVVIINNHFSNGSFNDQTFKQLWSETFEYRQNFIKQHTTADIMQQFPVYSNASMVSINFDTFALLDYYFRY